jgi:hypothetical protein
MPSFAKDGKASGAAPMMMTLPALVARAGAAAANAAGATWELFGDVLSNESQ